MSTTLDALPVDNKAVDVETSDESETSFQEAAKYKATMRLLGKTLCNWQFEKCYLPHWLPMHCEFKDRCNNFAHTR